MPYCASPGCRSASASLRCGICKRAAYCNKDCQRRHWKLHKPCCKAPPLIHVMIACHVSSDARAGQFEQCCKSLESQTADFVLFIGLSGPERFRKQCAERLTALNSALAAAAGSTSDRSFVHVTDEEAEQRAQFEHLRGLLRASIAVDPSAWLLFGDSDGMFHPKRVQLYQEAIGRLPAPRAFYMVEKLLLRGRQVAFGDLADEWRAPSADVEEATLLNYEDLDADEYLDWCVHTTEMELFMQITPRGVTSHEHCGLRFLKYLEHMQRREGATDAPRPADQWLYAMYKKPKAQLHALFDAEEESDDVTDHATTNDTVTDDDRERASRYDRGARQMANVRLYVESIVVAFTLWPNQEGRRAFYQHAVDAINKAHGKGLGEELFSTGQDRFHQLFLDSEDRGQLDMNVNFDKHFFE